MDPSTTAPDHARGASPASSISARAYAKVNLSLAVAPPEPIGAPRAGWHRIASWFASVDLWDDVHLRALDSRASLAASTATGSIYLRRWGDNAPRPSPIDWPEDKDLAVRAHRVLEQRVGRALPVHLELVKRIPTGGGLGGGSSDAAAVLRALTRLFKLPMTPADLRVISARLGSDVAYFIPDEDGGSSGVHQPLNAAPPPALVRGFGDLIEPAARVTGPISLVLPDVGCPTPAVYKAFDQRLASGVEHEFREREVRQLGAAPPATQAATGVLDPRGLFNDLTEPAFAVEPGVGRVARALQDAGHTPHLSGSGSTLFVLGDAPVAPPPGCVVVRTRSV